jgi:hypothetical protein
MLVTIQNQEYEQCTRVTKASTQINHYATLEYFIIHSLFKHYALLELSEYFIIRGSRWMQNELKYIKWIIQRERRA